MGISVLVAVTLLGALTAAAPNYFYFGPSAVPYAYGYGGIPYSSPIHISLPQAARVAPLVAPAPVVAPAAKKSVLKLVDVQEATQFHSQDGRGQFLFGYSIPDQARIESRTSDGTVRGSYSYLDPIGRAITVQYVADQSGYHAASNELPVSAPGAVIQPQPNYQQRVAQQYAASYPTLLPASIVGQLPTPVEDSPDVAAAREAHLRAHQEALEAHAAALAAAEAEEGNSGATPVKSPAASASKDSVIDSDEEDVGEQEEVDEEGDEKVMDEADEGVVVESDALSDNSAGVGSVDDRELTYEKDRYPKLQYNSQLETYDPARVHDEANQAVIVTNPEFAESPVSTRIGGEGQDQVQGGPGKGAFFYSFRHAVPVYVAVPQGVAAPPTLLARQQPYPPNRLFLGGGGVLAAPGVLPTTGVATPVGRSVSERASLLGAIPLAAVHDAQVSPSQRGSIKDHQTLPLYITPVEVEEN